MLKQLNISIILINLLIFLPSCNAYKESFRDRSNDYLQATEQQKLNWGKTSKPQQNNRYDLPSYNTDVASNTEAADLLPPYF